ncbi:MAG: MBL fold metallo-hydrolase, partial [Calditrichaeota bacterium]|nr:MBL fold metallo-hydrolase [Calditrichota bacterium]
TGNTRKSSQFILQGARYPEGPIDLLISEATYGADARAETVRRPEEAKRFARKVRQRLQLGGVVMLPVFALGRTQEMLAMIQHLRLRGHLPSVPVYITGMGLKINKIYDRLLHNIYPDRFDPGALRAM